jgi:DNA-binding response OmpR family regulator
MGHVVLIEDDPFLGNIASEKVRSAGYELTFFTTAEDALKELDGKKPDVILLDIVLPKMDGYEFLKLIKEKESLKSVPVVVLSNLGSQDEIEKGLSLGAISYLVKSNITPDDIVKKVEETMSKKGK